jgi:hypothetical protein
MRSHQVVSPWSGETGNNNTVFSADLSINFEMEGCAEYGVCIAITHSGEFERMIESDALSFCRPYLGNYYLPRVKAYRYQRHLVKIRLLQVERIDWTKSEKYSVRRMSTQR